PDRAAPGPAGRERHPRAAVGAAHGGALPDRSPGRGPLGLSHGPAGARPRAGCRAVGAARARAPGRAAAGLVAVARPALERRPDAHRLAHAPGDLRPRRRTADTGRARRAADRADRLAG